MTDQAFDDPVRRQYEAYPYPLRDPAEEKIRLVMRGPDYLAQINHFVFGGRQSFGPGARILVAGGGTGDETVFIAEQLRRRGGRVAYLDQSQASLSIARQRAAARGLDNIDFHHGRIEQAAIETLGGFDYIHSIGVLHHLASPELGLQRLAALLRPGGGFGLMLYARDGRLGNYQLQKIAGMMFAQEPSLTKQVGEMTSIIEALPPDHPFFRGAGPDATLAWIKADPNDLIDMVLHARDRPFSVGEIYDFLATAGQTVIEFVPFAPNQRTQNMFSIFYDARYYLKTPALAARLAAATPRQRQELAEMLHGRMDLHCFYAGPSASAEANPEAEGMIPFLLPLRACFRLTDAHIAMTDYAGAEVSVTSTPLITLLFELIDGDRTVTEIIAEAGRRLGPAAPSAWALRQQFLQLYWTLRRFNWLLLRHSSVPAFENLDHLYFARAGWREPENA